MTLLTIIFLSLLNSQISAMTHSGYLSELIKIRNSDHYLNQYITDFPFNEYNIYSIKDLGSFYIDDIPDSIKWHLVRGIYWESNIGNLVATYTKKNTIAIDLGAHIGIHTLVMSRCVGKEGSVIAFEPQFKIYRELFHNLMLNDCYENVVILRNAVGDEEKWIEMQPRDPINEGGTPVGSGGDSALMITLDSLELTNVSFIKMDVESSELNVLRGAVNTIINNKPVIVFEIMGGVDLNNCSQIHQKMYENIISLLKELNYRVTLIHGNDFIAEPIP